MIFEVLNDAAARGELLLVEGGFCHYHLRRDGIVTIREILVLPNQRGKGIGRAILARLALIPNAVALLARCPANLTANLWWENRGFRKVAEEEAASGRRIIVWKLDLLSSSTAPLATPGLPPVP